MIHSHHDRPKVAIFMVTYNHEAYIDQAIASVVKQQCDFNFRLIIGEDDSKDNTRNLCQQWAAQHPDKITLLPYVSNMGIFKNANRVFEACLSSGAEYIALLEGDDFWTDERKLQKQVDLLTAHPHAAGSFHNTVIERKDGTKEIMFPKLKTVINQENAISKYSPFHTSSFIFKSKYYCRPEWFNQIDSIDLALYTLYAQYGDLVGIDTCMSQYRLHDGGHTSSTSHLHHFHWKRILLHTFLKGKIQINFLKKYKGLIDFHRSEKKSIDPSERLPPLIAFLSPSMGDIDNSRFVQTYLCGEIIPLKLEENSLHLYQEIITKPWWSVSRKKWIQKKFIQLFNKKPDLYYVQSKEQFQLLLDWKPNDETPIILDFPESDQYKRAEEIPSQISSSIFTVEYPNIKTRHYCSSVQPQYFLNTLHKKKKIAVLLQHQDEKHQYQSILATWPDFEFHFLSNEDQTIYDAQFLHDIHILIIAKEVKNYELIILQLLACGGKVLLPNSQNELLKNFPNQIHYYPNNYPNRENIQILIDTHTDLAKTSAYIKEFFGLENHCQHLNELIRKLVP